MRTISIQVQPDKVANLDIDILNQLFDKIKKSSLVERAYRDEGDDQGIYINLNFDSENTNLLWVEIYNAFYKSELGEDLGKCTMVMCSGNNDWDDYLLLYHFDPNVALDNFS